ncbi:hypothetical protein [Novosphingobium sp. 11B]
MEALAGTLPMLLDHFVPDLILLQAGVDAHRDDRLGRQSLTDEGFSLSYSPGRSGGLAGVA